MLEYETQLNVLFNRQSLLLQDHQQVFYNRSSDRRSISPPHEGANELVKQTKCLKYCSKHLLYPSKVQYTLFSFPIKLPIDSGLIRSQLSHQCRYKRYSMAHVLVMCCHNLSTLYCLFLSFSMLWIQQRQQQLLGSLFSYKWYQVWQILYKI